MPVFLAKQGNARHWWTPLVDAFMCLVTMAAATLASAEGTAALQETSEASMQLEQQTLDPGNLQETSEARIQLEQQTLDPGNDPGMPTQQCRSRKRASKSVYIGSNFMNGNKLV